MFVRLDKNSFKVFSIFLVMILTATTLLSWPMTALAKENITFSETGMTVQGPFLSAWQQGGLAKFGYPISPEIQEPSSTDGKLHTVQYYERTIFEHHPENQPPLDVLLRPVGTSEYKARYGQSGAQGQRANAVDGRIFSETGKSIGGGFRYFWEANGALIRFGYPLSNEFRERSTTDGKEYTVQYFERARFEYHPENKDPHKVLLGLLGRNEYAARYPKVASSNAGNLMPIANTTVARACQTATLLASGKVLVAGGIDSSETPLSSAELFDPATSTFSSTGRMALGRACHTATRLASGKVLIAGGAARNALASAELYDPLTETFSAAGDMAVAHQGHRATLLNNGRVLITGGGDAPNGDVAELFDPMTGNFTATGKMTSSRSAHTSTLLKNGKVLITGGSSGPARVSDSAETYDTSTGTFSRTGTMTRIRHKHAAEILPDGRVIVLGGADSRDWRGRYSSTEMYDPETGQFTGTGEMSEPRFKFSDAVTLLKSGRLIVVGGGKSIELFDQLSGTFTRAGGEMDAQRFYMTSTMLQDGRVLILGGYDTGIRASSRAWLFHP